MIYWHVEKKSVCIYSQLKRCSSSEVAAMIEGVMRHCTEMTVEKSYVDSHGQSDVAASPGCLAGACRDTIPGYRCPPGLRGQQVFTDDEKDSVLRRLRRVEGQVAGLARMVEADKYCIDIIQQVSAAQGSGKPKPKKGLGFRV